MGLIGKKSEQTQAMDALARANHRAALIPDCLVEAKRVANIVIPGWHGRKKRGSGENFWQFRPYSDGENFARIDWRRSAREETVFVRDMEWEAAHTIWLWADLSPSMRFQSSLATVSKESRALVIMLALAEILARSGERVGVPGVLPPTLSRNAAEKLALALMQSDLEKSPLTFSTIGARHDLVLIADFLSPLEELHQTIEPLANKGVRGHLLEVYDPAEELFPYTGNVEFNDPETGQKIFFGKAQSVADEYQKLYFARRDERASNTRALGWNFITHRTDELASEALTALHLYLSGTPPVNLAKSSIQVGVQKGAR